MLRNHLVLALRAVWKRRSFSFINIAGLSIGLSAVLIIVTYLRDELSYDRFHKHADRIYRITEEYKDDVKQVHSALNHGPLADIISGKLAGLEQAVRIMPYPAYVSADKVNKHRENNLIFADSTFFRIFSFDGIAGDLRTALEAPFSVVITESMANKYFGKSDVVGLPLYYEDERAMFTFYVSAVIKDVPGNAHFKFDLLLNMASLQQVMPWFNNWHYPAMYIYLMTDRQVDAASLAGRIQTLAERHQPAEVKAEKRRYEAQPLKDIHLYSSLANEWEANAQIRYIRLFGATALFLLVIACINFMNLSTAVAAHRAREVGVRKALGAFRSQLIRQFLGEAFLITSISLLAALAIAELLLMTFFKGLLQKELSLVFLLNGTNILSLAGLLIFISVLAGLYPAFYLSRFKTIMTLRGKTEEAGSVLGLRRGLVVFQFFVSGLLMIGTFTVLKQVDLLRNKHLGFDQQQLISIKLVDRQASSNWSALKNELEKEKDVSSVALSSEIPGGQNFYGFEVNPEGFPRGTMSMNSLGMDEDYLPTYGVSLVAGRNFSEDIQSDATEAFILNEAAVKFLGWTPENAIGKEFGFIVYTSSREERNGRVVGVTRDFNYQTLYHAVEPLVMYINKHPYYSDFLTVKMNSTDMSTTLDMLTEKWKAFRPGKPLEFSFVDDRLQKQYESETRISAIFTAYAILSIIISCLGLFGLSAFSAQKRMKEIGIRKVLGANVGQIIKLLSVEYIVMVVLANVLAWPLAFYFGAQWLESFPYHISLGAETFAVTMLVALGIALLTVSVQSVKAALINPVKTLRSE